MPDDLTYRPARVFVPQGATQVVIATGGVLDVDGGLIDASAGRITWPPGLASGYIPLNLFSAQEVVSASGSFTALSTGTTPARGRINATTDPTLRIRWATGNNDPIQLPEVIMPDDLSTVGPITLHLYGEKGSGQASADIDAQAWFGVGDTEMGSTVSFTSAPTRRTMSIASGDIVASAPLNLVLTPAAHASGVIDLYGAALSYRRKSS